MTSAGLCSKEPLHKVGIYKADLKSGRDKRFFFACKPFSISTELGRLSTMYNLADPQTHASETTGGIEISSRNRNQPTTNEVGPTIDIYRDVSD